jgi:hypothetical protein
MAFATYNILLFYIMILVEQKTKKKLAEMVKYLCCCSLHSFTTLSINFRSCYVSFTDFFDICISSLHEIKCSSADELIGPLSYFDFGGVLLCETEQEP